MKNYSRTLSERETTVLSSLSYAGKTIFTTDDLKEFTDNPKNLLDWLVRKKWLLKIKNGTYLITPLDAGEKGAANYTLHSFVIASVLVEPYYIAYGSALNYHGLTDQPPPTVYVATTKHRNSKTILNTKFRFVTISPNKMFGTEETTVENRKIKISSIEKTLIDCLDHPEHCGGIEEIAKALFFTKNEIDQTKLVDFAQKLGNKTVIKRLGYLSEIMELEKTFDLLSHFPLSAGYSLLDCSVKKRGPIVERWKLVINVIIDSSKWLT
ncbi:MAG: transcriptional regulator [Nitrososphaerota archaeon]|jgi:predicted transcriptional regulator of viral defense system|nr:transcriptional regulator [Nitrososphaerota archaeon]